MKSLGQLDKRDRKQQGRVMHITSNVKNQLFIVLALVSATVVTAIFGLLPRVRASYLPLADLLLGLSGNLIVAIIIFLFLERGIKSLHPISELRSLPDSEFIESVRRAKKDDRIRILETFSSLINLYHTEFATAIEEAIKAGAEVEVMVIHPYSVGAKRRAEQLKGRVDLQEGMRKNLMHLYELESATNYTGKHNLHVKLYTALPTIQMYRCGEWAYVSLFPIRESSEHSPNLKVPMDNPFGSYVDDTFEKLWRGTDEAPTIPLDAHMRLQFASSSPDLSSGYFFAYDEHQNQIDKTCCFVVGESNTLLSAISENIKVKETTTILLDNKMWLAEPHVLNPKDSNELDELMHARKLIERRYGWDHRKLGLNPFILRFKNIKEVTG